MGKRRWEAHISREEIVHLLENRRYLDLLARLEEARQHHRYDLELMRSVRVLQHHLRLTMQATG